jgi:hypothetical protein
MPFIILNADKRKARMIAGSRILSPPKSSGLSTPVTLLLIQRARGGKRIDCFSGPVLCVRAKTAKGQSWEPKTKVNRVMPISSKLKNYLENYLPPGVEGKWYFSTPN